jgi:hypothetical protein
MVSHPAPMRPNQTRASIHRVTDRRTGGDIVAEAIHMTNQNRHSAGVPMRKDNCSGSGLYDIDQEGFRAEVRRWGKAL